MREHLRRFLNRALRQQALLEEQRACIANGRRALWERVDRLREMRDGLPAPSAPDPVTPRPAVIVPEERTDDGAAAVRTQELVDGRVRGVRPELWDEDRAWMQAEVLEMRRLGWSEAQLQEIGFGAELLAALGLDAADGAPPPRLIRPPRSGGARPPRAPGLRGAGPAAPAAADALRPPG
ncbi:hypothetical protein [Longimicrobium sp.]|uniref:hypothetical protein n=1 Tax=Longimicrobium sp. TaxID=2029185 RepID=UPI002E32A5EF|nr:hypothetical protein [Longimicrobium sp.]HEX6037152.1 hypothetical protein [Longimicrobium sp.]